jgi:Single Cache domain 2
MTRGSVTAVRREKRFGRRAALPLLGAGLMLPLLLPRPAAAGEDPRKAVVEMVEGACAALAAYGFPRGIGRSAPDTWSRLDSGLYVFLIDRDGNLLLHPDGQMEGRNVAGARDARGEPFMAHILAISAARPEGGWVSYLWPGQKNLGGGPGETGTKHTFAKLAVTPAGSVIIAAAGYVATET